MNLAGVGLAGLAGLLGVWLYLAHSSQVDAVQRESAAHMDCRTANFDADFSQRWGDDKAKQDQLKAEAKSQCDQYAKEKANADATSQATAQDKKELKQTIDSMMK